jgi:low affinity Fe/Cu permease
MTYVVTLQNCRRKKGKALGKSYTVSSAVQSYKLISICDHFSDSVRSYGDLAMETPTEELKSQEKERDIFCLVSNAFRVFARHSAIALGSAWAFAGAILIIFVWILTGPMFHFSDTWQLVINTATTIVTFLMVFLIQNTQNRDAKAMHLKLDELIRALKGARNELVDLEDLSDEELKKLEKQFQRMRKRAGNDGSPSHHAKPAELR